MTLLMIGQLTFNQLILKIQSVITADVAQLVRALDCGSKCRGFESRRSPFLFFGLGRGLVYVHENINKKIL
jgi:hypothetical protein